MRPVEMVTIVLLFTIFNEYLAQENPFQYPFDYGSTLSENPSRVNFDFIVVGGGSSGATVAARLSEISHWNVLLLEAGGDPPETSEIPLQWMNLLKTKYDWNFATEKLDNLYKGMENGVYSMPRGRMLGGSSSLNAMIYLRGTEDDFNSWKKNGCEGWGYDDVLPYFKLSEDFVDTTRFNSIIHSRGGPITVSPLETSDKAYTIIEEAEKSLNMKKINDFNDHGPVMGYGDFDSTTREGRRCSTLKGFLIPVSNRTNLYVAKQTLVTRIIIENNVAKGVEFLPPNGKEIKSVACSKEVILSAGPINSPQILMLSGIGPKAHLEGLGISVISDLQVGFNLQDHISFPALVFSDRKYRSKEEIQKESTESLKKESSYYANGIATLGLSKLMAFYKSKNEMKYPNIQILQFRIPYKLSDVTPNNKSIMTNLFGFSSEIGKTFTELNSLSDLIVMSPITLQPTSTGQVKLRSKDPLDRPIILVDLLANQEDKNTLIDGIEFVMKMANSKPMLDGGLVLENLMLKACDHLQWGSREYWSCAVEYLAVPFFHCVGTCRMGSKKDNSTVVNPSLRVHGINGLRVIDSSVMHRIVSVNTNAASIMIGEKGADMIKKHYGELGRISDDNKADAIHSS